MPAYVICQIEVTDPQRYEDYRTLSSVAAELYGARFVVRGGPVEVLEGERAAGRVVVLEFADEAAARRWYDSPEYRAAREVRREAATSSFLLVRGAE